MTSTHAIRIIDASLNRAGEGLRVVEDYVRFVLDDAFLSVQMKSLRHELVSLAAVIPSDQRHAARDTIRDVGATIANETESRRDDIHHVCAASLKRTEQSLRSIEEYGKLIDASIGRHAESLRYRLYTLEKAIDIVQSSQSRLSGVNLCVLISGCGSLSDFKRLVGELVEARVGMIQLRDKNLDDRELVDRARVLVTLTRRQPPAEPGADRGGYHRTLTIINDRADIAAAVHADGVHLGQEDLGVKDARTIVGTQMLIGVSTHNIEQARRAVLDGANYLGAGPTFPSQTKSFNTFAGLNYLREVAGEIRLPTFAIGGITPDNVHEVLAAGITRVAVSSAITTADKPACAASSLLDMLNAPNSSATESTTT